MLGLSFESNLSPSQNVVVALPPVVGLSFESNLSPKLEFDVQTEIGLSLDDMRERVVRMPAILGYSREKRFHPRLAACRKVGAEPTVVLDRITQPDSKFFPSIGMEEWDAVIGGWNGRLPPPRPRDLSLGGPSRGCVDMCTAAHAAAVHDRS